jgi:hypothetical protein
MKSEGIRDGDQPNEQFGHLIERLLMSAGFRLVDYFGKGKIDRLHVN